MATSALSGGPKQWSTQKDEQLLSLEQEVENTTTQYFESPRRLHQNDTSQDFKQINNSKQNIRNMRIARISKDFDVQIVENIQGKDLKSKERFTEKSPIDSASVMSPRMISQGPRYNQNVLSHQSNQNLSVRTHTTVNNPHGRNSMRQQTQHTAQIALLKESKKDNIFNIDGRTSQEFEVKTKKERQKSSYVKNSTKQNLMARQIVQRKKTGVVLTTNKSRIQTKTNEYHIEGSETSYTKREGFSNDNGAQTQNAEQDEIGSQQQQIMGLSERSLNPSQLNSNPVLKVNSYSVLNQSSSRQSVRKIDGQKNIEQNRFKDALSSHDQQLESLEDKDDQIIRCKKLFQKSPPPPVHKIPIQQYEVSQLSPRKQHTEDSNQISKKTTVLVGLNSKNQEANTGIDYQPIFDTQDDMNMPLPGQFGSILSEKEIIDINNLVDEIKRNEGFIAPKLQGLPLLRDVYTIIQDQFKKGDDVKVWDLIKTKIYLNAIHQNQIKFIEQLQINQKQEMEQTLNTIKQKDEKTLLHDIATILSETDRKYQPWSHQRGAQFQCHNQRQMKDKQQIIQKKEKYLKKIQKNTQEQVTEKIQKFKDQGSKSNILQVLEKGIQYDKDKKDSELQLNSMNLWTLAQILEKQKQQIESIMTNHQQIAQLGQVPSQTERQFSASQKSWNNKFAKSDKSLQEYTGNTVSMNSLTKSRQQLNQKSHTKLVSNITESHPQSLKLLNKPLISPLSMQQDPNQQEPSSMKNLANQNTKAGAQQSQRDLDSLPSNRVQQSDPQFSKTLSNLKSQGNNCSSKSYVNILHLKNQSIRQKNMNQKEQSSNLPKDFVLSNQVAEQTKNDGKVQQETQNAEIGTERIQIFDIMSMNQIDITQTQNGTLVYGDRSIEKKDRKEPENQFKFDTFHQKSPIQIDMKSQEHSNSNISKKILETDQDLEAYAMTKLQPLTQRNAEPKEPIIQKEPDTKPEKQAPKNSGKLVSGFKFLSQKPKGVTDSHDSKQIERDIQIAKSMNLQIRTQKIPDLKDIKIGDFSQMNKLRKLIKGQSREDSKENEPTQGFSIQFDECKHSLEGAQVSEYKVVIQNDHDNIMNEDLGSPVGNEKQKWRRSLDDSKILSSLDNHQDNDNIALKFQDDNPSDVENCSPIAKTRKVSARSPDKRNLRTQEIQTSMKNLKESDLDNNLENNEAYSQDKIKDSSDKNNTGQNSDALEPYQTNSKYTPASSIKNQRISSGKVRTYNRLISGKKQNASSDKNRPKTGSKKSKNNRSNETTPSIPQNLQNNIYLYQKNSANFKYVGRSPSANKSALKTNTDLVETWNLRKHPSKAGSKHETNNPSKRNQVSNSKGSSINKLTNFDKKSSSYQQNSKNLQKSAISKSSYSLNNGENEVRLMESKINNQLSPEQERESQDCTQNLAIYNQVSDQFDGTILELTKEHTLEEITQMHLSQTSPDKLSPEHHQVRDSLNQQSGSNQRKNSRILVQKDFSQSRSKDKQNAFRKSFDYITQTDQTQKLEDKSNEVQFEVEGESPKNNEQNFKTEPVQSKLVAKKDSAPHQGWNNVNPSNISAKIITKSQSGEKIGNNPTMSSRAFPTGRNSRPQSSRQMDLGIQSSLKIQGIKKERKKLQLSNNQNKVVVSAEQIYSSKKINFSPQLTQTQEQSKRYMRNQIPIAKTLNDSQEHLMTNKNIRESESNIYDNLGMQNFSLLHKLPKTSKDEQPQEENPQIVIYSSPKQDVVPRLQIPIDQIDLFNKQIKAQEDIWIEAALEDMSIKKLVQNNNKAQHPYSGRKSNQRGGLQKGISLCTPRTNKSSFCSPVNITKKGASRKELDVIQTSSKPMQVRQSQSRERSGNPRPQVDNKIGKDLQVVNFSQQK